jgi:WD40 repeat protein
MYRKYTIYARNEPLACIKSSPIETKMALSYNCGTLKIYDYLAEKVVFSKVTHISRIGTIDWQLNNIITGSRDRTIKSFDPRTYGDNLIFPKYHQQ